MISPLGWLYGKIINLRNSHYESGTLKSYDLGAPTISVGNITVGGTGKTPLVAYIADFLSSEGEVVCIISRGYKRENEAERVLVSDGKEVLVDVRKAGDEPFELATKLLGKVIVISDANRVDAGKWAVKEFGVTAIVLDDAFQHLKAKRDLDIVVIDATNPFGNGEPLPSGILREPIENLNRADFVVITRANLVENTDELTTKIRELNLQAPIVVCHNSVSRVVLLEDFLDGKNVIHQVIAEKAVAFCALGNPDNFFDQLSLGNFEIVGTKAFPDHNSYVQRDIDLVEKIAARQGAKALLTTAKDAVKLGGLRFTLPCYVVKNNLVFEDEKKLRDQIDAVFKNQQFH